MLFGRLAAQDLLLGCSYAINMYFMAPWCSYKMVPQDMLKLQPAFALWQGCGSKAFWTAL